MAMLVSGCATLYQAPTPITNSVGTPDLAKYKTFTVANTALSNTPEFLRDLPTLQNIVFRFQQEGFQFVDTIDKADFVITASFIDAMGQKYIPPRTYTSVSYNPGTTTTNIMGTATGIGDFVNIQGTAQSTSTASMETTTTTTGGYFVPNYGVALAINIYDSKTQQLVWSGSGAGEANVSNISPAIDSIILRIIDQHLITPAYLKGNRSEIRKAEIERLGNEYLKPLASPDKVGFYQVDYKDEIAGVGILCRTNIDKRGWLVLTLSLKNNTDKEIDFKFSNLKIVSEGKSLYMFTKSEMASAFFKAGNAIRNRDEAVRDAYNSYLEERRIVSNEHYLGYVYAMVPLVFPTGSELSVSIPLGSRNIEVAFVYQKGWMTIQDFQNKFKK